MNLSTVRLCAACNGPLPGSAHFCPNCGKAAPQAEGPQGGTNLGTMEAGSSLLTVSDDGPAPPKPIDHGQFVPGTLLGERFRIVGLLGKGGMGEVYRADDLKLHQVVALKFLPANLGHDTLRLDRLRNEVRVARQVSHPNVCRVYDLGEIDGQTYLSMEYVDGEDLASLLRRIGRLPGDKAIEIARQVCAGLTAAHEKGIVHRDLKPMNIMIDGRGKVRITDFGLASLLDDEHSSQRGGTPAYMAPEQLKGRKSTVATDVYSLGLVLYEAFTGKRAFEARNVNDLIKLHAESTPTSPSRLVEDLDPAVERAIMRCLEVDPEQRPPSAMSISAALPGGDPLAAALMAGETPSPELVAAAAHKEGMPPAVCLACVLFILLGLAALPFLSDQVKLHALCDLQKSPQVLIDKARAIVHELASSDSRVADIAYCWTVNQSVLLRIEARELETSRWSRLSANGPSAMEFWYRQSPESFVVNNESGVVSWNDPPKNTPGSVAIRLDSRGRLVALQAVPPMHDALSHPHRSTPWARLLELAELPIPIDELAGPQPITSDESATSEPVIDVDDSSGSEFASRLVRLSAARPERIPPSFADERRAWSGRHPRDPDVSIRVEAAALEGVPTFFEVTYENGELYGDRDDAPQSALARYTQVFYVLVLLASVIGGAAMARSNLRLGRGDRRGAVRIAVFVASAIMMSWILQADHVADPRQQFGMFARAAGRALFVAGMSWLLYMACEPHVRRRWPDMLISWSRLLAGRYRDPIVGRDILIGGLFGILAMVLIAARHFGPTFFGAAPPRPTAVADLTFLGLRYDLAQLLTLLTTACLEPMVLMVLLVLLLELIRERFTTMLAFYLLVTGATTFISLQTGGSPLVDLAYHALLAAMVIFVLLRFGLLAVMFAIFFTQLLDNYPVTSNFEAWYGESTAFALLVAGSLAAYGYFAAMGGRRLIPAKA